MKPIRNSRPAGRPSRNSPTVKAAPPPDSKTLCSWSSQKVTGWRVNPPLLRWLGWVTSVVMTMAPLAMIATAAFS